MFIIDQFGEKLDLSFLSLEEKDLLEMKLSEVLELKARRKSIDWDRIPKKDLKKIELLNEEFNSILKKATSHIENYLDLCQKAQTMVLVDIGNLVPKQEIINRTTNYPGLNVHYKTVCSLKNHSYIYSLMLQNVLKNREVENSLASFIRKNPEMEMLYDEVEILDKGAAMMALQRAYRRVADVLAGKAQPDYYNDEFCVVQQSSEDMRAIFISIAKRNRRPPNLNQVSGLINNKNIYFDPNSESRIDSVTKIKVYCGSVDGVPTLITVKVPYFMRSYSIKTNNKKD